MGEVIYFLWKGSQVVELVEHRWKESAEKSSTVLLETFAGVVDTRIQVAL